MCNTKARIIFPNLKTEMERRGHSLSDLAELIRCNERTLSSWLSGKTGIGIYFAVQIAKVYDCSIDYLFRKEEAR